MQRLCLTLVLLLAAGAAHAGVIDDFHDVSAWTAAPSDGVSLSLSSQPSGDGGRALCLDFDFKGHGGFAAARRAFPLEMPPNYAFSFRLRGDAPSNNLEMKLVDATGSNVWWVNRKNVVFPRTWTPVRYKKRHVEFAWGPAGGGDLAHLASIEFTVTAGSGGAGRVCIDRLEFTPLPPDHPYAGTPVAGASSSLPGRGPDRVALTGAAEGAGWHSAADGRQSLAIDFGEPREFGGLVIDWDPDDHPVRYAVETSDDGRSWTARFAAEGASGRRAYVPLPDAEARAVRLRLDASARGRGYGVRAVVVQPLAFGATPEAPFFAMAADAPRGTFPRWLAREQSYWTVVGADGGGAHVALFGEDGAVEPFAGGFSIEPILRVDGRLVTWNEAVRTPALDPRGWPSPSVTWRAGEVELAVRPSASATSGLRVEYGLANRGRGAHDIELLLAVRPFQVNPPWQFLGTAGGLATVRSLAWDGRALLVDGERRIVPETAGARFGATPLAAGEIGTRLVAADVPVAEHVDDPAGRASGALRFAIGPVAPDSSRTVAIAVPGSAVSSYAAPDRAATLDRARIDLPAAPELAAALRANLAYILVDRDGPALRPGARAYARSWIRDGALMSEALLRLGHADVVRDFLAWFARYQYDDGKVPCCVDARGSDPVPENDSHGEFIWAVSEYERYTHDRAFAATLWPQVAKAAGYLDALRRQRRTPEYLEPRKRVFYGLLPESISHEGYSAKPMHSYWDDTFGLLGFEHAGRLARVLGHADDEARFAAMAAEFRADFVASVGLAMADHHIDYIPGCAELGDFDATSTAIALAPGGLQGVLPKNAVDRTFEKYWANAEARRSGTMEWRDYTPYEWRVVGSLLRLGQRDRALGLVSFLMDGRRPAAWQQWPEIVWRDLKAPKFLGDLPHAWVGAEMLRATLDLFAYERASDHALVIAAGVPDAWRRAGFTVRNLQTPWGPLSYTMAPGGAITFQSKPDAPGGVIVMP